MLFDLTHAT